MDRHELRAVVLDALKKTPHTHFRALENDVRRASDAYERRDVLLLNEILWDLLLQGILAPGKNSLNPDLPFIHVTEYGTRCLDAGAIVAHDPDRYVERLRDATESRAPDAVYEAARLGLVSFLDGRFEASLLLLAHAAEQVLADLADALIRRGRRTGRGTKRLEASRRMQNRLPEAVLKAIGGRLVPKDLAAEAEGQAAGLVELVRSARSEKGASRIPRGNRDIAQAQYLLFPDRCRFAYDAIRRLDEASA